MGETLAQQAQSNTIKKIVHHSIQESIAQGLLFDNPGVLTGFSGKRLVGTLQRLSSQLLDANTCYLEVGVFQGLTLLSVAQAAGENQVFGIDNFAYFDREGKNFGIVQDRMKKLNITNATIINQDYEDALENLGELLGGKKVGVYFIDGPHDYRSQLICLLLIKPFLAERAVIVVDDCNYRHVRQANHDFLISHPEFKLAFDAYTDHHPLNTTERSKFEDGWWNGVNIVVKDPENELKPMFPETFRDRTLYENEHAIHAARHPEVVPFLLKLTNFAAPVVYRFSKLKRKKAVIKGNYQSMNTYSDGLVSERFNPSLR